MVLDSVREKDFHEAFETWKRDGTYVYVSKETILKKMVANIENVKPFRYFPIQPNIVTVTTL
jgi:hypothetical protein